MQQRHIVLLSDFGDKTGYVGQMKGVILSINDNIDLIDLSHSVDPQNTREAELVLEKSYQFFPKGSIFVAVVDPGVGSSRPSIIAECDARFFVGPDNGTFGFLNDFSNLKVYEIENKGFMLPNISATFHGRDIFASVAAHLSKGQHPAKFGPQTDIVAEHDNLNDYNNFTGSIIAFDGFGNAISSIDRRMLVEFGQKNNGKAACLQVNSKQYQIHRTFSDVPTGEPLAYIGSFEKLEIAVNQQNAREILQLNLRDKISLI